MPNVHGKTVTDSSDLLAILSFNIAYNLRVFPSKHQWLNIAACYLVLSYTGCQPVEVADGDKSMHLDGSSEELFSSQAILLLFRKPPEASPPDAYAKEPTKLLERKTTYLGHPKVLCYKDIQLLVVRHP